MRIRFMDRAPSSRDHGTDQAHTATLGRRRRRSARPRRYELEEKISILQRDYADLHAALFEAAQVHRRLCAPRRLHFGGFHIASEIFAVRQLPGDFFVAQETPHGITLSLGDVCGKGLAAGMWVTHVAGLIAMHSAGETKPCAVVAAVHKAFRQTPAMPLTSLFQARLDPASGRLDYCNAGHPPALLLRANGGIEELLDGGSLLGAFPFDTFAQGCAQLEPGDALVIYSDGILDSSNPSGEQFGPKRWEQLLRNVQADDADALLLSLLGAVQDHAGGYPIQDDMSLVVIRREAD
jgi:sigma-B regulation protein RsbU (phosphoserine phosphatase)